MPKKCSILQTKNDKRVTEKSKYKTMISEMMLRDNNVWFTKGKLFKQMMDDEMLDNVTDDVTQEEHRSSQSMIRSPNDLILSNEMLKVLPESTLPFTKPLPNLLVTPTNDYLCEKQCEELCESWLSFISAANYWIVEDVDFPPCILSGIRNLVYLPETLISKLCDSMVEWKRPVLANVFRDIYDTCRPKSVLSDIIEVGCKHDYLFIVQILVDGKQPSPIMLCEERCSSGDKSFRERSCPVGYSGTPGVKSVDSPVAINICCQYGSINCLRYLCDLCDSIDYTNICERSAYYGHLDCLRFAHERGGNPSINCYYIWSSGNLPCIQYSWEHRPTKQIWYKILEMFIYRNYLDCLHWGLCIWSKQDKYNEWIDVYQLLEHSMKCKHIECFKKILAFTEVLTHNLLMRLIQYACKNNQPEFLSIMYHSNRSPFLPEYNSHTVQPLLAAYELAAESGSLDCMKIINQEFGIRWPTKDTLLFILREDHVHCLEYWLDTFPEIFDTLVPNYHSIFKYMGIQGIMSRKCFQYAYTKKMCGYLCYYDDATKLNLPRPSYDEQLTWEIPTNIKKYEWPPLSEFTTWVPFRLQGFSFTTPEELRSLQSMIGDGLPSTNRISAPFVPEYVL
jgi:hypothetical protein